MQIEITDRQLHTVLAALRYWQSVSTEVGTLTFSECTELATNSGACTELNAVEIDELCEDINCGG